MDGKRVVIAADHGGFELKNSVKRHLETGGFSVIDLGVFSVASVDYPDIAERLCREYLTGNYEFGILFCGTGIGVSIAANKIRGIRCAVVHDVFTAEMAKSHNHANVLAFGGRVEYRVPVETMIDAYVAAPFARDRHERRIEMIASLEAAESRRAEIESGGAGKSS